MGCVFKSALVLCTLGWKAAEEGKTKRDLLEIYKIILLLPF